MATGRKTHDYYTRNLSEPEPEPEPEQNESRPVWDMVIDDMRARDQAGRERYGTPLQPHNGRDALIDLYQELLDAAVYARQAIFERDGK